MLIILIVLIIVIIIVIAHARPPQVLWFTAFWNGVGWCGLRLNSGRFSTKTTSNITTKMLKMSLRRSKNEHVYLQKGTLGLQNEPLDVQKDKKWKVHSNWLPFGVFWVVLGRLLGSIWRSFCHQFCIYASMSFLDAFWRRFGSVLASIWEHFRVILGTFSVQKGTRSENTDFHENHCFPIFFHDF